MNFIENTIFPQSFDSLRKECNTALKTSPGGSKTTFLPIKLQQSIIQAAMYALWFLLVSLLRNQIALILIERMTDMSATINAHFAIKREYFASYNDARILWYLCS